jgi:hypothetical protein
MMLGLIMEHTLGNHKIDQQTDELLRYVAKLIMSKKEEKEE